MQVAVLHLLISIISLSQNEKWIPICLSQSWCGRDTGYNPNPFCQPILLQLLPTQVQTGMHFPAVFVWDDHETMLPSIQLELNWYMELLSHLLKRKSRTLHFCSFYLPTNRKGSAQSNFEIHQPGFVSYCMEQSGLSSWNAQLGSSTWK